jgi:hypothetical protein
VLASPLVKVIVLAETEAVTTALAELAVAATVKLKVEASPLVNVKTFPAAEPVTINEPVLIDFEDPSGS